jgi:hypothetical protein
MTRSAPATVLLVLLAAGRVASADNTALPNGATLAFEHLFIHQDGATDFKEPTDAFARRRYFNLAHCQCSKAGMGMETTFQYRFTMNGDPGVSIPAQFWVGTTCNDPTARSNMQCRQLASPTFPDLRVVRSQETRKEFSIYDAIIGKDATIDCTSSEASRALYLLADTGNNGMYEYSLLKNIGDPGDSTSVGTGVDTQPPPAPTGMRALSTENGIVVTWDAPTSNATDVAYYQALCVKVTDGAPVRSSPPKPLYRTANALCGLPDVAPTSSGTGTTDATALDLTLDDLPAGLKTLDAAYLCEESQSGTATSLTIGGLANEASYAVVLVAIDAYGNFSSTFFPHTVIPHEVTDLWEKLHQDGSLAEGGLCLLAETYGGDSGLTGALRAFRDDTLGATRPGRWLVRAYYATLGRLGGLVHGSLALRVLAGVLLAPLVALGLTWHALTLPGLCACLALLWLARRARRDRAKLRVLRALPIVGALIAVWPGAAHAGGNTPYWEDAAVDSDAAADEANAVTWIAGVRVGPYTPDIDRQLGTTAGGPFATYFKSALILPMLDVDRVLWSGFGQLGVTLSLGYTQRKAKALDPKTQLPVDGSYTAFHVVPTSLSASYRLTVLDDRWGVPIIPYARAGLAYSVWWITDPAGNFAKVCKDASAVEPTCAMSGQNRALGGSLGVIGALGVSIRAERIDAQAAQSMRQSGIEHAGIYGEVSISKVDGFGSKTKLAVGDRTWFAGVNFEF